MNVIEHVRYNRWASRRTLESVAALTAEERARDLKSSYGGVHGTLVHIYQADRIWFARLQGEPTGSLAAFAPPAEWDAFVQDWTAHLDHFVAWAEKLDDAGWRRVVAYRDTKGNAYETPVYQILLHLANHNSYHRGQVTAFLRQLGHTPVATDLIFYYREQASSRSA